MSKKEILDNIEKAIDTICACYIVDKTQRKIIKMLQTIYEAIKNSDLQ